MAAPQGQAATANPPRQRRRDRGRGAGAQPARQPDHPNRVQNTGLCAVVPVGGFCIAQGGAVRSRGAERPRTPPAVLVVNRVVEPAAQEAEQAAAAVEPVVESAAEVVDNVDDTHAVDQNVQHSDVPEVEQEAVEQAAETVDQAAEAVEQAAENVDNVDVPSSVLSSVCVEDTESQREEGEVGDEAGNEASDQMTDS